MRRDRGLTLSELLVACFITVLIALVAEGLMNYVRSVGFKARAQLEPRQQVRSCLDLLARDLRAGAYIYEGFSGTLAGTAVTVPNKGGTGNALVFALPEDVAGSVGYRVCAVFPRVRSKPDPNNPGVREMVYLRFAPLVTSPPETPGALDPGTLTGASQRVFDTYLVPGTEGVRVRLSPNGEGVDVRMRFSVKPLRGPVVSESFETCLAMRNNV